MTETHEEMRSFFDTRAEEYDEYVASVFEDYENFYRNIASP